MSDAKIYTYPLIISEVYLDSFGHVNNAAYLTLFEEARWDLLNKNNYGIAKIKESQLGPTVLEIHMRYLKELRPRDEIIITTQALSYEGKIGRLQQSMLRQNEPCCVAEFVIGLFDLKNRKLVMPTEEWLRILAG